MRPFSLSANTLDVTDELLANARASRQRVEKPDIRLTEVSGYLNSAVNLRHFGNVNDVFVAAAYNSWQARSKIAVAVDPDMVQEIIDTQASEIPGEMFTRLPYVNPLVVFPQKIETTSSNGHRVHILGFFAYGRRDYVQENGEQNSDICDTDDPSMNRIGFLFISYVPETGNIDFTRVSARLKDRVSLEDAIVEGVANYGYDHSVPGVTRDGVMTWFGTLLSLSLNISLYLVSSGADMQKMSVAASNKPSNYPGAGYARPRKTRIVRMGWVLGPRLRRLRREYDQNKRTKNSVGTGTVAPHPVRAHFRTYWTGSKKSKQVPIVRFITPFWTGLDSLENAPNVLIRK